VDSGKGKNYLFDRRMEQRPGSKPEDQVEQEIDSKCCVCRQKWTVYRGKFKCSQRLCGVPVIVCDDRVTKAMEAPKSLTCDLRKVGYKAPQGYARFGWAQAQSRIDGRWTL
jgi:predicted sulfurtransferase